ncbi:MAG: RNA polymerase sigma factor [Myxococcota bacterium]
MIAEPAPLRRLPTVPTTEALVLRARAGDRWAADALFRRHGPEVLRVAAVLLGRSWEAEDVAQDAFLQALTKLHALRDPSAFGPWVTRVAANMCRSRLRHRGLLRRFGLDRGEDETLEDLASPTVSPELRAELAAIAKVLSGAPAEARVAWTLRRVEGWALQEIVETVRASLATVKRRISAVDARLDAHVRGEDAGRNS